MNHSIAVAIGEATGQAFQIKHQQAEHGGSINSAFRLSDGARQFFVKTNRAALLPMFAAEAVGLEAMRETGTIRVPEVVCYGTSKAEAYLVLEYIELRGRVDARVFGAALTAMHQVAQPQFGFAIDNTIGSTPQPNTVSDNWVEFYREQRLLHQLDLLKSRGSDQQLQDRGRRLCAELDGFFTDYRPTASLLHGDLWSGNWGADAQGNAVIFDPACYCGDREADLAMTELFGSPGRDFYAACNDIWAIDAGYKVRRELLYVQFRTQQIEFK